MPSTSTSSVNTVETLNSFTRAEIDQDVEDFMGESLPAVPTSELQSYSTTLNATSEIGSDAGSRRNETPGLLAPVDRGFGAWSFLAGAFLVEAVTWAFPMSSGVFLAAYMNDPRYGTQHNAASILPLVGPLSSGIIYCSGPVVYPLAARYPWHRRTSMFLGVFICWGSLLAASFAEKIWPLVLWQGAAYGIGGSLLYAPCISFMSEWFVQRRGLANGVIFAGAAVGGLLLPTVLPFLLHSYGSPGTLRILSTAILVLLLPVLPFVRSRIPGRIHGPVSRDARRSWKKDKVLWLVMTTNTMQGFAYFVPVIWLPTFASAIGLNDTQGSFVIALFNAFSVISRLSYGVLSDHFSPWLLGISSLLLTSLSTFVLWGVLSTSWWGILSFSVAYGTLSGGWTSLWTAFVKPIAKDDAELATNIFGILMLSRGIGNILSTPISTSLLGSPHVAVLRNKIGFNVDGGRFENMICYVGSVFAVAGLIASAGWTVDMRRSAQVASSQAARS